MTVTEPVLKMMAAHNAWANQRVFAACSEIDSAKLNETTDDYDSIVGILEHLVQVEHAFFELAHGRVPQRIESEDLAELREKCAQIDRAYVDYTDALDSVKANTKRFLVPWFGFEITLTEGVVQPLTHSHKHRADVSMLLPRLDGSGVEMDFIQWLEEQRDR
ncbi:MAG TPA: DinB family protein [Actinomycetota bacterium]|nr:DinB family protein [Actinomycetota bacterium]